MCECDRERNIDAHRTVPESAQGPDARKSPAQGPAGHSSLTVASSYIESFPNWPWIRIELIG